jgi:hypothetical protein
MGRTVVNAKIRKCCRLQAGTMHTRRGDVGTKIMTKYFLLNSMSSEQALVIGKFPLPFTTKLGAN